MRSMAWARVRTGLLLCLAGIAGGSAGGEGNRLPFVPWPGDLLPEAGVFAPAAGGRIAIGDETLRPLAQVLAGEWRMLAGLDFAVVADAPRPGDIALRLDAALPPRGHRVRVTDRVEVWGGDTTGAAFGTASLLQAVRSGTDGRATLPRFELRDAPGAAYCGTMLDVARQWHPPDAIREVIDLCRFYKIEFLHLHLTDDQAFTFPSKAYPRLGTRNEAAHGGQAPRVYTREELDALVDYAEVRGVVLVPELDTPAHTGAMRRAMPELFGAPGLSVIDMANPAVYEALDTLVGEICEVFRTSPYVHIGGDEAWLGALEQRPETREYLAAHGLANVHELFSEHVARMNESVKRHGRKAIVWEDAPLGPRTPRDIVVMVWRISGGHGATPSVLAGGREAIQVTWVPSVYNSVREVYSWRPFSTTVPPGGAALGSQMVLWEREPEVALPYLRYKSPPRHERTWNPEHDGGYDDFARRLALTDDTFDRLRTGIGMTTGTSVQSLTGWLLAGGTESVPHLTYPVGYEVRLDTRVPGAAIRFTLDGREPTADSPVHDAPIAGMGTGGATRIRARLFDAAGLTLGHPFERFLRHEPFSVDALGTIRPGDSRFGLGVVLSARQHVPGGILRYQIGGPVGSRSPEYREPIRIDRDATVAFRYFDDEGAPFGETWKETFTLADHDPTSLTFGKPVTATQGPAEVVELTVDGLVDLDQHLDMSPAPQALTVDLGAPQPVARVALYTYWDGQRSYRYRIETSRDGEVWQPVADASDNRVIATAQGYDHRFEPADTRYLRVTMLGNTANRGLHIVELRAFGPGQKPLREGGSLPREQMNDAQRAFADAWAEARPADRAPAEIAGTVRNPEDDLGPRGNVRLAGDANFWASGYTGLFTGDVDLDGHTLTVDTGGGNVQRYTGVLSGDGLLVWNGGGSGDWQTRASFISGDHPNTFRGTLAIRQGTLALAKPDGVTAHVGDLVLGGGRNQAILQLDADGQIAGTASLRTQGTHPARVLTRGHSATLGTLTLGAPTFIDFGNGASTLAFADSSAAVWTAEATLTVENWTPGRDILRFGDGSDQGLTDEQLGRIVFVNPGDRPDGRYPAARGAAGMLLPASPIPGG